MCGEKRRAGRHAWRQGAIAAGERHTWCMNVDSTFRLLAEIQPSNCASSACASLSWLPISASPCVDSASACSATALVCSCCQLMCSASISACPFRGICADAMAPSGRACGAAACMARGAGATVHAVPHQGAGGTGGR